MPGVGTIECHVIRMEPLIPGTGKIETWWFTPGIGIVKWISGDTGTGLPGRDQPMIWTLKYFSF